MPESGPILSRGVTPQRRLPSRTVAISPLGLKALPPGACRRRSSTAVNCLRCSRMSKLGQSCSSMIGSTHAGRSPSLLGFCSVTAVDRFGRSRSPKLEAEMTEPLSPNTQAIVLLTAPLLVGRKSGSEQPLTATEYTSSDRAVNWVG
jgi:hypothetical protein